MCGKSGGFGDQRTQRKSAQLTDSSFSWSSSSEAGMREAQHRGPRGTPGIDIGVGTLAATSFKAGLHHDKGMARNPMLPCHTLQPAVAVPSFP
jgi:hypothetical protein